MKAHALAPIFTVIITLATSSCRHKDIDLEVNDRCEIYVTFDWRNAPDANPSSMMAYFYPASQGEEMLYTFADATGGQISIPYGYYAGIGINGDNTEWASIKNTDDPESFEVNTGDAESLEAYGLVSRSVPRAPGTEEERMAKTPGMIWSDRRDNIALDYDSDTDDGNVRVITFYPEEGVCHYTVDVIDIEHSEYLHGSEVDATLSGMAEGYLTGKRTSTDNAVTMPFTLKSESEGKSLHSEFLTFGECANTAKRHILTVYVLLTDGTKWYQTYDVTGQVTSAPDPRNVHIVVKGLNLPKPIAGGSGFLPDVNEWNDININLTM